MPELSRFFGVVIRMYHDDHQPPHFHAAYGDEEAVVDILELGLFQGFWRPRVRRMVMQWARLHQAELLANWERVQEGEEPTPIDPLG